MGLLSLGLSSNLLVSTRLVVGDNGKLGVYAGLNFVRRVTESGAFAAMPGLSSQTRTKSLWIRNRKQKVMEPEKIWCEEIHGSLRA